MAKSLEQEAGLTLAADWDDTRIADLLLTIDELVKVQDAAGVVRLLSDNNISRGQYYAWKKDRTEIERRAKRAPKSLLQKDGPAVSAPATEEESTESEAEEPKRAPPVLSREQELHIARKIKEAQKTGKRGAVAETIRALGIQPWFGYSLRKKYGPELGDGEEMFDAFMALHRQQMTYVKQFPDEALMRKHMEMGEALVEHQRTLARGNFAAALQTPSDTAQSNGQPNDQETATERREQAQASPPVPPDVPASESAAAAGATPIVAPPLQESSVSAKPPTLKAKRMEPPAFLKIDPSAPPSKTAAAREPEHPGSSPEEQRQLRVIAWAREQGIVEDSVGYTDVVAAIVAAYEQVAKRVYSTVRTGLGNMSRDRQKLEDTIAKVIELFFVKFDPPTKSLHRGKVADDLHNYLLSNGSPVRSAIWRINRGLEPIEEAK